MAWLTETEYRDAGAAAIGVTINAAFLHDIKTDFGFRELLNEVYAKLGDDSESRLTDHQAADLLGDLRDELETYFALEEFYGYFSDAAIVNPNVSQCATALRSDHERLFLELNEIVEQSLQIAYDEADKDRLNSKILFGHFEAFCIHLALHEQSEMDLMMRLCNEDIGVGD